MKTIDIYSNEVIIQENLEHTISYEYNKLEYYINNKSCKKVVVSLYNEHLIALDGNKLCTINRLLNKKIPIIFLENKEDFDIFYQNYNKDIYTSRLINWQNWQEFKNDLEFFENRYGDINKRDYFNDNPQNKEKLLDCLNYTDTCDMYYNGISNETLKLLRLNIDTL